MTYDVKVQQYGTYFAGYPWQIYGCGTYRERISADAAEASFKVFRQRLKKSLGGGPISCIAVRECRYSGCGYSPIAQHWHFLMAALPQYREALLANARSLWSKHYGDNKIDPYDPKRPAAYYVAKLAGGVNFEYQVHQLKHLPYAGHHDLYRSFQTDPYVPAEVRDRTWGKILVTRPIHRRAVAGERC